MTVRDRADASRLLRTVAKSAATVSAMVMIWGILSEVKLINPLFMPTPHETILEAIHMMASTKLYLDISASLYRILAGVALSLGCGIPLGLLLGYFACAYSFVEGTIDFFRSIPPVVTFPLSVLIFGTGDESRIAVIFFGCVFIAVFNGAAGVLQAGRARILVAKSMGAGNFMIFRRVIFYEALPQIFTGIRIALSMGVIVGIVCEMLVGTPYGLGSRIVHSQTSYATAEMYFTIILTGILGLVMNRMLSVIEARTIHWKEAK